MGSRCNRNTAKAGAFRPISEGELMANHQRHSRSQWTRSGFKAAALALALIVFQPREGAGAPPKPPKNLSVATEIVDVAGGSTIASDGGGVYQDNVAGISSILTANTCNGLTWGDWRFDSTGSSRFVNEGFFQADETGPGPWTPPTEGYLPQHSWMNVQCTCTAGKDMYLMTVGQAIICPLLNNFNDAVTGYGWGYSPAKSFTGYTETTDAQITCNAATDHCVDWFIDPIPNLTPGHETEAVGRAVEHTPGHPRPNKINHGDYYMRFRIHVALP